MVVANMAEVDPEVMAEKVNQLEEFINLSEDFNSRSLERVLSQTVKEISLKKLHLATGSTFAEDRKQSERSPALISEAKKVISCVKICI